VGGARETQKIEKYNNFIQGVRLTPRGARHMAGKENIPKRENLWGPESEKKPTEEHKIQIRKRDGGKEGWKGIRQKKNIGECAYGYTTE